MAQNLTFNLGVETGSAVTSINQFFSAFDQGAAKAKSTLNTAFNQKLETEVEINLKDGELVAKQIQKASQESKRLEVAAKAINGEFGKTPASLKKQVTILKQIQSNTQKFSSTTGKLSSDWKLVTQRIQEASSKLQTMTQGGPLERLKDGLTGIIGKFTLVQTLANLATSAIQSFAAGGQEFLNMAGRMETLQLQLEAFTGGSDEAAAAFEEFARIAANSPFNLEQVASAGKIMMAFGVDTDTAVRSTEQLGIAAAATGGDVNLLARNLGQIAAQGQAYTRDLTQFAIQGIPIWEEMSKVTGKSVTELKSMASEGQISFDIVSAALTNLTAEGTAFAEVAKRMQETFQGRMAKISAAFNTLGLDVVNAFNKLDRSMGGVVSGSMKAFAEGITWVGENIDNLVIAFAALTAGIATYAVAMTALNLGHIGKTIGTIVDVVRNWSIVQKTLNILTAFFQGMSGNWAAIGIGIAAAATATVVMSNAMADATEEEKKLQDEIAATTAGVGDLTEAEKKLGETASETHKEQMSKYEDAIKARDELGEKLEAEIERLKGMKEVVKERYEAEIDAIEQVITKDQEKLEAMKTAHEEAMNQIEMRHSAALDAIDVEIGALREKTAAEQELYDYQKKQLEAKIASGELEGEQLLQAEARLSRMERQEEIQELLNEKSKLKAEQEKEIVELTTQQNTEMQKLTDKIKEQEKEISNLKEARDEEIKKIDDAINSSKRMTDAVKETNKSVDEQIKLVDDLSGQYATASKRADDLTASLRDAAKAQRDLNSASSGGGGGGGGGAPNMFAGGSVSGGTPYTVNELGREAFLSSSGKLSMINAPAWGQWTAPGSGTVIPAHLTSQLNVPTGGVQLNKGAASKAAGAGGSSDIGRMMRALAGAAGGDTISNNVTIQTENPRQTASDVMVQLAKLKRLRYN